MILRSLGLVSLIVVMSASSWGMAQEDKSKKEEKDPSFWMKQKLTNSERILEGLAKGDLDMVNKNATAMQALNRIEHFVRRDPVAYRTQLHIFQFSVDELVRTSKEDNLDGAALAFTQMTISCVNCHKQIRKN
jgi:hypothetical protein